MDKKVFYAPVSKAIEELRLKGYTLDFNLEENCISCKDGKFAAEDFEITEVYRYEGATDPADEATVYGISSANGIKGILVSTPGAYSDAVSPELLQKLK
jgi:hypothetical protein